MKRRLEKKIHKRQADSSTMVEWLTDYRAYLVEAMYENIDLSIIDRQFKARWVGRPKNQFFSNSRMTTYRKVALG